MLMKDIHTRNVLAGLPESVTCILGRINGSVSKFNFPDTTSLSPSTAKLSAMKSI